MQIEKEMDGNVLVMSLSGEFDTLDVDRFSAEISETVDEGTVRVALKMADISFINSTALGALLKEQKRLEQAGGDLACCELSPFVDKNFKLLGIERRLKSLDDVEAAITYLKTVGAEGIGVVGENQVAYTFADEEEGKEAHAELREIHSEGMSLVYDNLDDVDVEDLFRTGRHLKLRFRLPLYHPTHEFKMQGAIGAVDASAGRKVTVRVAFESVSELEKEAIEKFVADIQFIEKEVGPEGEDG